MDNIDPIIDELQKKETAAVANVGLEENQMTEDEIENLISESDPDFKEMISSLQADKNLTAKEVDIDDSLQSLYEEIDKWKNSKGISKILFLLFPFLPKILVKIRKWKFTFKAKIQVWAFYVKDFIYYLLTQGWKKATRKIIYFFSFLSKKINTKIEAYSKLSFKLKLGFVALILLFLFTIGFSYRVLTKGVIKIHDELFLSSFEKVASSSYEYDPQSESEPFYENLRVAQNIFHIQKIVVNIRSSSNSGQNPMAAFDIYIEGTSSEVVIEVKDREIEIKDLIAREAEQFTFADIESAEGKRELLNRFLININRVLTTGSIKSVKFKTIILKP